MRARGFSVLRDAVHVPFISRWFKKLVSTFEITWDVNTLLLTGLSWNMRLLLFSLLITALETRRIINLSSFVCRFCADTFTGCFMRIVDNLYSCSRSDNSPFVTRWSTGNHMWSIFLFEILSFLLPISKWRSIRCCIHSVMWTARQSGHFGWVFPHSNFFNFQEIPPFCWKGKSLNILLSLLVLL
jgi:hypothetical protein